MTHTDDIIGLPQLAWELGIKKSRLADYLYEIVPQTEWPGKGRPWKFDSEMADRLRAHYQNVPERWRQPFTRVSDDDVYDIIQDIQTTGFSTMGAYTDVAALLKELIEDHDMDVELTKRSYWGVMIQQVQAG